MAPKFTPAVGQPVVIAISAWLDEDGYYTWDGESGIRAGDVLSVRPSDGQEGTPEPKPADVPDAAVDAAAKLLGYGLGDSTYREHVRRVLAAAAPFMNAQDPS